jgi:hypothetical protein
MNQALYAHMNNKRKRKKKKVMRKAKKKKSLERGTYHLLFYLFGQHTTLKKKNP